MAWPRFIGFCLLAAAMVMLLRQLHPPTAGLLSIAFSVLMLGLLLPEIGSYVQTIRTFLQSLELDAAYYRVMLKAMGIVWVTQLAVQSCRDMDAPSVARSAAFCGRIALLSVAIPVFMDLTRMAVSILR